MHAGDRTGQDGTGVGKNCHKQRFDSEKYLAHALMIDSVIFNHHPSIIQHSSVSTDAARPVTATNIKEINRLGKLRHNRAQLLTSSLPPAWTTFLSLFES